MSTNPIVKIAFCFPFNRCPLQTLSSQWLGGDPSLICGTLAGKTLLDAGPNRSDKFFAASRITRSKASNELSVVSGVQGERLLYAIHS
jgi:hypothetical protein